MQQVVLRATWYVVTAQLWTKRCPHLVDDSNKGDVVITAGHLEAMMRLLYNESPRSFADAKHGIPQKDVTGDDVITAGHLEEAMVRLLHNESPRSFADAKHGIP